ncbi:MAG: histone H1 [Paracoccaceae bacterium]
MTDKPKRPRDANQLAKSIVDIATDRDITPVDTSNQSKGGRKGGKARATSLSSRQRSEIAQKAAAARWKK